MKTLRFLFVLAVLTASLSAGRADIMGPYTVDANTLHLWHLDESTVPAIDSAAGGTNLTALGGSAVLGTNSFSGFGTALNTLPSTGAYLGAKTLVNGNGDEVQLTYADPTSGAFTFECIVRVGFDPDTFNRGNFPLYLIMGENESGGANIGVRPWQFRILGKGATGGGDANTVRLYFLNVSGGGTVLTAPLPTTGPDAILSNNWYHVAITFAGGTGGALKMYWTLMDPSRLQANQIGATTMNNLNPASSGLLDFSIGNVGRSTPNGNWVGLIDEVRISKVARSATEMMFNSAAPNIATQPVGSTNAIGQSFGLSVVAGGSPPLGYQWRLFGTNLPGATTSTYNIPSAQFTDAGDYDVVVTNASPTVVTSSVATVLVRVPTNVTWIGSAGVDWETALVNWDSDADNAADTVYSGGDNVLFNDVGFPLVNLVGPLNPSSVTVNNSTVEYLFSTTGSGSIVGNASFTKQGTARMALDTDNTYTGPTVIAAGTLQVGNGTAKGSLGTGPVTNSGVLVFDRTGTLTLNNSIAGTGDIIKNNTVVLELLGTNTFSGNLTNNRGNITVGPTGLGGVTNVTLNGFGAGNGTSLTLRDVTIGPAVTISSLTGAFDNRTAVIGESGTNILNCPITIDGGSSAGIIHTSGRMEINGPVTGLPTYTDYFTLRGNGTNAILRGTVTLPSGFVQKTDLGTWVLATTNSSYLTMRMLGGTVRLACDNAIATNSTLLEQQGLSFLDLAGFNQTFSGLADLTPLGVITNSSTTTDSRLSLITASTWTFASLIANASSGPTRKLALTLDGGGSLSLSNANTYSGDTTIKSGTLGLVGNGSINNSTPITIAGGAMLDASGRINSTLTLTAGQVLTGNGTIGGNLTGPGTISPGASIGVLNVNNNATLSGTTLMEVDVAGGTNDQLNVTGTLTYGGNLVVTNIGGGTFSLASTFKLFNAAAYAGTFGSITPSVPAFGLKWDPSTMTTDGTLRVATIPTTPTNMVVTVVGSNTLQIDWPASHTGWTLQMQTNSLSVGLSNNWLNVPGSAFTNQVNVPIGSSPGSVFFRMTYP